MTSFGHLHAPPPEADVILDLRAVARDPRTSAEMRGLTGLEPTVRDHVLRTPGVPDVIDALCHLVTALLPVRVREATGEPVRIALGCAGGRHRCVAIAEELAVRLMADGVGADVSHRDIHQPVVTR